MHMWQWGNKQFHNTLTAMERCLAESSDVGEIMSALQAKGLNATPLAVYGATKAGWAAKTACGAWATTFAPAMSTI
jgi:hypothetical protein